MVTAVSGIAINEQVTKRENGTKFAYCPCCSRKGFYKMRYRYERCRYCGLHRVLLPGQDF